MPPKRSRVSKALVLQVSSESHASPLFTCSENSTWHNDRKFNKLIVESFVSEELDKIHAIRDAFDTFGWSVLFDLPESIHEGFVREFYANMEDKLNAQSLVIRTSVQGVPIELNVKVLSTILGVAQSGSFFDLDIECLREHSSFDHSTAFAHFRLQCIPSETRSYQVAGKVRLVADTRNRFRWPATGLGAQEGAILYCLHHNVIPVAHESGVRKRDIYLLYRMLVGMDGLPKPALAPILIQSMRRVMGHTGKCFIYPRLLTLVFQYFCIPLAPNTLQDCSTKIFTSAGLRRMCTEKPKGAKPTLPMVGTSEAPSTRTWQEWALHFDARLDHQEELLKQILSNLKESGGKGSFLPSS